MFQEAPIYGLYPIALQIDGCYRQSGLRGGKVTLSPGNGFTGAVYLSCALTSSPAGAIHLPTCSIPTSSVNITDTNAVTATMAVNSTAPSPSATSLRLQNWRLLDGKDALSPGTGAIAACFFLLVLTAWRRNLRLPATFLFVLAVFGTLLACGGGSTVSSLPPPSNPGTTAGTYVFTVSAALSTNGVSQAQTTVTVTIQ